MKKICLIFSLLTLSVSTLFSVTPINPTTFNDHEAASIFAAIDFPLSAIKQQNDPFTFSIFAEIDKTFGKPGIALDPSHIDMIKKTYLYLIFLAKLEKVRKLSMLDPRGKPKDDEIKKQLSDFSEFTQDNNQQLPHLPTQQLISSAGWSAVKVTSQDLVNSQAWQLFCKAMITDIGIYFSIALQTIHNVEKQTFNYIPHFETSFYNADYTSLRTINEITRTRIDLEETLKQRYLSVCPDWNAIANPVQTTAVKSPKAPDAQAIFGKTIVTFMHTRFYQATHDMNVLAGTNNNSIPQFKSPLKEQVWCYFMLHEVHGQLTKFMTDLNLSQMLDVMSNSQLIPNIFPYTTDDYVLLDELLAAKCKAEGNQDKSIHPSPSNFHVEDNISTSQVQNDPRLRRHIKELHEQNAQDQTKKEVQVQSFWSDLGHDFTSAWSDVKSGVETAVKAVEHIGEAAGQGIAGAGATLAAALGSASAAVGSGLGITGLANIGGELHDATSSFGKSEFAKSISHLNQSAKELEASVNDYTSAIEDGIVAPIGEVSGKLVGYILNDQAIGTDISSVINQTADALYNIRAEAFDAIIKTAAVAGDLGIRYVQARTEFAETVADAAWAISSKQGQQAFLQDGQDLGKTCLHAIVQSFTGLLHMTEGALISVLNGLTAITNSLTTLFIDLAREITYLVLSGRILLVWNPALLIASEYVPVGNKFADQARDDVRNTLNAHRGTINQVMGVAISLVPAVAAIVMSGGTAAPAVVAAEAALEAGVETGTEVATEEGAAALAKQAAQVAVKDAAKTAAKDAAIVLAKQAALDAAPEEGKAVAQTALDEATAAAAKSTAAKEAAIVAAKNLAYGAEVAQGGLLDVGGKNIFDTAAEIAAKEADQPGLLEIAGKNIITEGPVSATTATKAVVATVATGAAEIAAQETTEAAAKEAAAKEAEDAAQTATKQGKTVLKKITNYFLRRSLTNASEEAANAAKNVTKTAVEAAAKAAAKQAAETTLKEAAGTEGEAAARQVLETATKEAEAAAKAATKAATEAAIKNAAKDAIMKEIFANQAVQDATDELNVASKDAYEAGEKVYNAQTALSNATKAGDEVAEAEAQDALDSATSEEKQAEAIYKAKLSAKFAAEQAVAALKSTAKEAAKVALDVATKQAEQASKEALSAMAKVALKQDAKQAAEIALRKVIEEGGDQAAQDAAQEALDDATNEVEQSLEEATEAQAKSALKTAAKDAAKQAFDSTPKYADALEALKGEAIGLVMNAGFGLFNIVGGFNQDQNALLKENNQANSLKNLWKFINENKLATAQNELTYLNELQEKQQAEIGNQTLALALYQNLIYAGVNSTKNQIAAALAPQYIQNLTPDANNLLPADIGSSWGLATNYLDLYPSQGFFTATTGRPNFPYAQEIAQAPLAATQSTSTAKPSTPIPDKLWFNQRTTALDLLHENGTKKQPSDTLTVQIDLQFIYTLNSSFHVGLYLGGNYQNYSSRSFLARLLNTTVANVTQQLTTFQSFYASGNFSADGTMIKTPPANLINSSLIDIDQARLAKMLVLYRDSATDLLSIGVYEHEGKGWILKQPLPASLQLDKQHTYHLTAVLNQANLTVTLCADNNPLEIVQETMPVTPIANQRTYGIICSGAAIEWNQIAPKPQLIVNGSARPATKVQSETAREKQAKIDLAKETNPNFGLFKFTHLSKRRILLGQYVYHTTDTDLKKIDPKAHDLVVFATMQNNLIVHKSLGKHPSKALTQGQTNVLVSLVTGSVYDENGKNIAVTLNAWKNYETGHGPFPTSLGAYITTQQAAVAKALSNINFGKFVLDIISPQSLSLGQYIYTCTQTINAKDSTGKPMIDYLIMAEVTNNTLGNFVGMSPTSSNAQGLISLITGNLYLKNTVFTKGVTPQPIAPPFSASEMLSSYSNSPDYITITNAETAYGNYLTAKQQQKSTTPSNITIIPITPVTSQSVSGVHLPLHGVKIGLSKNAPGVHLHFPGEKSIADRQQSAAGNAGFQLAHRGGVHLKL
ncbi:MAG: hypothetical protein NTZ68_02620 [Candidatus Dependentiae bacterium]|nr:hypothetical protein [Candidatus Dependentiae bacterium]